LFRFNYIPIDDECLLIFILDGLKSSSSGKNLLDMQKQLDIRMRTKRAAMLAENTINLLVNDDDDDIVDGENDNDEASVDTTDESHDDTSEVMSTVDKDNVIDQE
jgi:hypothetical protein